VVVIQFSDVLVGNWGAVSEWVDIVHSVRLVGLNGLVNNPSNVVRTGCLPWINKELQLFVS
jgi:hypothetical protein